MDAPMDIFCAASVGHTGQIDARLAEDPTWLNAAFSRVLPTSPNPCDIAWATPLWKAVMNGQAESARHLLAKGADASLRNPDGKTMAEYATAKGFVALVEILENS